MNGVGPACEILVRSGSRKVQPRASRDLAELIDQRVKDTSHGSRDDDHVRLNRSHGLGERRNRRVGSEKRDAPPVRSQNDSEQQQGKVVLVSLGAREDSARPVPAIPPAGEREQPTSKEVADEVLLADRELTPRPPLPDLVQIRDEHVTHHDVERETRQELIERSLRADVVEVLECVSELVGTVLQKG